MRDFLRIAIATAQAGVLFLVPAAAAFAEHETRDIKLQESGVNLWLFAAALGTTTLALVAFAAVMLWWERSDARGDAQN